MPNGFYVQGNTTVSTTEGELGYSEGPIKVSPMFHYRDINSDDFPNSPAFVLWMLGEVSIEMSLVYFDSTILYQVIAKSMGAAATVGSFGAAGKIMTGTVLTLATEGGENGDEWAFPKAFLSERPVEWPLGNERSVVKLTWRAVGTPTAGTNLRSNGVQLFT